MKHRWAIALSLLIVAMGIAILLPKKIKERQPVVSGGSPGTVSPTPIHSLAASSKQAGSAGTPPNASNGPPTTPLVKRSTDLDETAKLDVSSAQATVETQLDLLRRERDEAFAATFLPSVTVTPEATAACKKRVQAVAVRPDWEMAQDSTEQGHAVRRVSMFGKSMTGVHETGHRWLADALWCVPTGLP